jgi:hypothetical protein
MRSASSVPGLPPGVNAATMKKASAKARSRPAGRKATGRAAPVRGDTPASTPADEILPEYDFRDARPNPYARRYAESISEHALLVTLDPDVAAVFPDSEAVNAALRALAGIIAEHVRSDKRPGG